MEATAATTAVGTVRGVYPTLVRLADRQDLPELAAILNQPGAMTGGAARSTEMLHHLGGALQVAVLTEHGTVASVAAVLADPGGSGEMQLVALWTDPDRRRRGYANATLAGLAPLWSHRHIHADVDDLTDPAAVIMLRHRAFRPGAAQPDGTTTWSTRRAKTRYRSAALLSARSLHTPKGTT